MKIHVYPQLWTLSTVMRWALRRSLSLPLALLPKLIASAASPDSPRRGHPRLRRPAAHAQPRAGDAAAAPAQRAGDARALPGQVLRPKLSDHEEIRHAPEAGE